MNTADHVKNTNGLGLEIHEFMDKFWDDYKEDHHIILHHMKGVDYVCNIFGEDSRWIAMQHLKDDGYDGIHRQIRTDQNDPLFKEWTELFNAAKVFANRLLVDE